MNKKTNNEPKYVLFEPEYVGWDKGLDKTIDDAVIMGLPIAVKSKEIKKKILEEIEGFLNLEIIVI